MKITLTKGSLNLLRGLLAVQGLEKTPEDIYIGGELLVVVVPEVDLAWVLTQAKLNTMSEKEVEAYREKDKAWSETAVEFEVTDKQRDNIRARLKKAAELTAVQNSKWLFLLYKEFGFGPQ